MEVLAQCLPLSLSPTQIYQQTLLRLPVGYQLCPCSNPLKIKALVWLSPRGSSLSHQSPFISKLPPHEMQAFPPETKAAITPSRGKYSYTVRIGAYSLRTPRLLVTGRNGTAYLPNGNISVSQYGYYPSPGGFLLENAEMFLLHRI
jgi:hypothetical protein